MEIVNFYLYFLQVLSEDEKNVKALFRRGKARAELGQTDAAKEDLEKARKHAPQDKAVIRELHLLAEHDKAIYQKQKEIYKGIFGPRPEPKPKSSNRLVLFWQWLVALVCNLLEFRRRKQDWKPCSIVNVVFHCTSMQLFLQTMEKERCCYWMTQEWVSTEGIWWCALVSSTF